MKILVISLAGIGDTLIATPLLRELRANFSGATIDVLAMWPGAKDLLENNPHVNRGFPKNFLKIGRFETLKFLWSLRRERYQLSVNTHPQSRIHYRIAAFLVGAPVRISHEYDGFNWLDRRLVTGTLPQDYARHSIENNFDVLAAHRRAEKITAHEMEIFLTADEEEFAEEFLAKNKLSGKKILGVHVGSGGTKNLPLKTLAVEKLCRAGPKIEQERPDIRVLLFGGPEEAKDHEVFWRRATVV